MIPRTPSIIALTALEFLDIRTASVRRAGNRYRATVTAGLSDYIAPQWAGEADTAEDAVEMAAANALEYWREFQRGPQGPSDIVPSGLPITG